MVLSSREFRRTLPAMIAGLTVTIVFLAVLSIVLTAAGPHGMGLSERRTSGWIALIYGLPMGWKRVSSEAVEAEQAPANPTPPG